MTYTRPRDTYFETQVFTAPPQKLQLMLLDGALTYARQAIEHWRQGRSYEGGEAVIACQRIITELLRGLKAEVAPDLVGNVASIYNFVFRSLTSAGMRQDQQALNDAIAVLEIERETWRQVCEHLGSSFQAEFQTEPKLRPHFSALPQPTDGGFSIEA